MEYAAAHQFGVKTDESGKTKHGVALPWGTIPARPFIGISSTNETAIIELIITHLEKAIESP